MYKKLLENGDQEYDLDYHDVHLQDYSCRGWLHWYLSFAIPGLGMFSEAYIIFAVGQIGPFQKTMYPTCYKSYTADLCTEDFVAHLSGYIQIIGIILGMLVMGFAGDWTGRKWGSRIVAATMLTGVILLTFTPFETNPTAYFFYFNFVQTYYGFGVGGEYPMAASSAAERAEMNPHLRHLRGQQVVLVFSNQGLGNLVNGIVILVAMFIFGQTGPTLSYSGSQQVMALQYGIGAVVCVVMVAYRFTYLEESEMFENSKQMEKDGDKWKKQLRSMWYYWPRQFAASMAWMCNDFAFYGNKLQQGRFISILYPAATNYVKQKWTVLNAVIGLMGYYGAAVVIDKPWYGRRLCQNVGFFALFFFYIIIYAQWDNMNSSSNQPGGMYFFQSFYYLSSFFNQFGPNCTTWLVAGEIFPTDIRTTNHGIAAAMGKVGAIIASLWISLIVESRPIFFISAMFALGGNLVTYLFLPDTTGLDLKEIDEFHKCVLDGRLEDYHGDAVNPQHLSPFEIYVFGWHRNYIPPADKGSPKDRADDCIGKLSA